MSRVIVKISKTARGNIISGSQGMDFHVAGAGGRLQFFYRIPLDFIGFQGEGEELRAEGLAGWGQREKCTYFATFLKRFWISELTRVISMEVWPWDFMNCLRASSDFFETKW